MKKKIGIGLILLLIIIQFFQIDKTKPTYDKSADILSLHPTNDNIKNSLINACYDCHSNETEYPWYTSVTPLSWWIKGHIKNGREELNFSEWASYNSDKKNHKLEESIEMVEDGKMPPKSYKMMHSDAKISDADKKALLDWFKSLKE